MSCEAMKDIAIHVNGLGKQYHIGAEKAKYRTLRSTLTQAFTSPFRRAIRLLQGHASAAGDLDETMWALRDVSFDVRAGEVVGIIGRNGAGKSTLLKILSRITEPTEGFAEIRGRIGSLLEVGTGFNQELTGRENVYLNGAILGMKRREIDRKFDQIVDFAEVGKFVDTPVKHYSSGMYVRLAFAVAAHMDPEILVVDEVLSVGDAEFQQKCLGKMKEAAGGGRTVLFVSHNMTAVAQLCERAILLDEGRIVKAGEPRDVIGHYLSAGVASTGEWQAGEESTADARIERVRVKVDGTPTPSVPFDQPFTVELLYRIHRPMRRFLIWLNLEADDGTLLWQSWDIDSTRWGPRVREPGLYRSSCRVPASLLRPGHYVLTFGSYVKTQGNEEYHDRVLAFDVSGVGWHGDHRRPGVLAPVLEWDVAGPSAVSEAALMAAGDTP
jgi:lipopolysaccharide transport system ATP-binding protein